jgi:hypothetical protein
LDGKKLPLIFDSRYSTATSNLIEIAIDRRTPPRPVMRLGGVTPVCSICLFLAPAHAAEWLPVDPVDLALKTPEIDKDADNAKVMFWDVRVNDDPLGVYGTVWT